MVHYDAAAIRQRLEADRQRLEDDIYQRTEGDEAVIPSDPISDSGGTRGHSAERMLRLLSGRWHEVLTGVALIRLGGVSKVGIETTRVRFAELSQSEIDWYVSTGEPRGKAGAYAIQGRAALFVEEVSGDYFNIVGLPIRLVYEMIGRK